MHGKARLRGLSEVAAGRRGAVVARFRPPAWAAAVVSGDDSFPGGLHPMGKTEKLTCLVDNAVLPHSRFRGEHGLSFLVETAAGRVLFDTGASGEVLLHNMEVAGISPAEIDALVLSHGHRDHTGGLPALLAQRSGLPLYAHPDLPRERFSHREGAMREVGLPLSLEELRGQADLRLSTEPQEVLPGVWTTGEIADRPEPEGRSDRHFIRADGAKLPSPWMADPYRDDMALVLEAPQGLVLVCGCCHAGLLNTLLHVRRVFERDPVAVAGGTHLIAADEAHLRRLIEVLRQMGPPTLYLNHCTGQAAYVTLALAFGERVAPCPAGTILELRSGGA